ncbi:MAG: DegT/DnrJ/EryC1/StrS family aminotransferase [Nitrospirae bacterium]|nr:DegT/DnrJ/EryC1/StrS family aminotransferase [Nitrospirota bacterium]
MIPKTIRLSKSIVGSTEKDAIACVIDDSYLGMGSFVHEFEERLKKYLEAKHVICINSGTAALHLALMSAGLKQGDEVLVQSLTYISSFQAITAAGLKPVPCEVIPEICTIDLRDAGKRITNRTKAIMPVHYASRVGNLDEIYEFAREYHLRVIEDAAHAFGTIYKGRKVGSFGDIVCFSFDGIKNITSGEGGAVITSDDAVAQFVKDARLLGVHKDTEKRYEGQRSWEFDVTHQGYRYHMSNLFAAVGIVQLNRFEKEFKPKRQMIAKRYHEALSGIRGIILFPDDYDEIVPHIFPIRVLNGKRDGLRQYLLDNSIECGIHYYPNHLLTYYGARKGELPVTERIYSELLTLPIHPDLTLEEQDYVIEKVKTFLSADYAD